MFVCSSTVITYYSLSFICTFSQVVRQSADVLNNLSTLRRDFELKVDKNVVSPLSRLVDDTRTDIEKERRAFKKAMSDVREARDQLDKANAQLHQLVNGTPVTNNTNPALSAMSNNNAQLDVITAANNRCSQAVSVLEDKERELMTSKVGSRVFSCMAPCQMEQDLPTRF